MRDLMLLSPTHLHPLVFCNPLATRQAEQAPLPSLSLPPSLCLAVPQRTCPCWLFLPCFLQMKQCLASVFAHSY